MKQILPAFILFTLLFTSCSDKLSRSKAEDLIKQHRPLPYEIYAQIPKHYIIPMPSPSGFTWGWNGWNVIGDEWVTKMNLLKSKGLITIYDSGPRTYPAGTYGAGDRIWHVCDVALTEEGHKYGGGDGGYGVFTMGENVNTLRVCIYENDFDKITGIVEQEQPVRAATVTGEFKRIHPTPFNDIFNASLTVKDPFTFNFQKYDDGWRIAQ